jgi:hypothetical protein
VCQFTFRCALIFVDTYAHTLFLEVNSIFQMAYGRSSDGMRLLSACNIIIDLVLPFIFNSGRRLWDCRFYKYSL